MNKTNKILITVIFISMAFSLMSVSAHGEETLAEAEHLIEDEVSCEDLTDEQLEAIGDYYMEQMHPGEAHEKMDEMMGGEGSESLKNMHISMAYRFYCDEEITSESTQENMPMGNMMGYSGNSSNYLGFQILPLFAAIIIILLIMLIYMKTQKK